MLNRQCIENATHHPHSSFFFSQVKFPVSLSLSPHTAHIPPPHGPPFSFSLCSPLFLHHHHHHHHLFLPSFFSLLQLFLSSCVRERKKTLLFHSSLLSFQLKQTPTHTHKSLSFSCIPSTTITISSSSSSLHSISEQMHSTTTPSHSHPSTSPPSLSQTLDLITHLLSLLLLSSLTIKSFIGRWQILRSKLSHLQSSLTEIAESPHWVENPLLQDLLPNLLSSLHKTHSLSQQCQKDPSSFTGGKLLMQSDIDISSASLSAHLHDIDLLLKSGVLRQSNAIVLSQPGPGSGKEELGFFIRDLFARLQIGGIEFKKKAMDSLLQLLREDDKAAILIAKEGDVRYLVHLLDSNHQSSVREQAALAVSILASSSDSSRKCVFEEGGLGPLLRLLESGSSPLKETSAMAIEAITSDHENAWAISAYGGIPVLIEACRSGSPITQAHSVGALKNVAAADDIRVALADEGVIPVLLQLLISGTSSAQEKAANCLWILASAGEEFRVSILTEGGLQSLLQLLQESSNSDTLEHVLRAIYALSRSPTTPKILSFSTPFILQLSELIKNGNLTSQQISTSILCNLNLGDYQKRSISSCMGSLVKMMESSKPVGLQENSAEILGFLLSVRSNRKELIRDEKSVMRLVQMLDPKNDLVCKKFPVMVISAILSGGSHGCRKKLISAGAYPHLQKLAEVDVAGAKKALQRLTGNRLKNIFLAGLGRNNQQRS